MKKENSYKLYFKQAIIAVLAIVIIVAIVYGVFIMNKPKDGDTVSVDYTLYVDGKVFDTSIKEDAVQAGIVNENRDYAPLEFVIGQGQMIKGFEDAVKEMRKGQTKDVEIKPEDAYGLPDEKKIFKGLNIVLTINKTDEINATDFVSIFNEDPKIGELLKDVGLPWELKILSVKNGIVKIENILEVGQEVNIPGAGWISKVESIEGNTIKIRQEVKDGDKVTIPTPAGAVSGVVINVNDEGYDIDLNGPLAGKTLKFKITLVDVKKK